MGKTNQLGVLADVFVTDTSNNVGIGGSPSGSYKLEVTGTAKVSSTLLVSGAATFSASSGVSLTINGNANNWSNVINGSTTTGQSYGSFVIAGTNSSDISFLVKNAANSTEYFKVRGDGAATFSSSIQAVSYVATGLLTAGLIAANTSFLDQTSSGTARWLSYGSNSTTRGAFSLYQASSTNTLGQSVLDISSTGAATFNSQVAIGTAIIGGYPLLLKAASGDTLIYGLSSNGTYNFDSYLDGTSGQLHIRNGSCDVYLARTAGTWVGNSDKTIKENIILIENSLEKVLQLNGYYYNLINDENKNKRVGLIAQEVEKVLPEATHNGYSKTYDRDIMGVEYDVLIPLLINAIKEQQLIITSLEDRLTKGGL